MLWKSASTLQFARSYQFSVALEHVWVSIPLSDKLGSMDYFFISLYKFLRIWLWKVFIDIYVTFLSTNLYEIWLILQILFLLISLNLQADSPVY